MRTVEGSTCFGGPFLQPAAKIDFSYRERTTKLLQQKFRSPDGFSEALEVMANAERALGGGPLVFAGVALHMGRAIARALRSAQ